MNNEEKRGLRDLLGGPLPLEGDFRIPSGCAISGIVDRDCRLFNGDDIISSISVMRDRSNGLGGGFAAYGIYPQFARHYAFHLFFEDYAAKEDAERLLYHHFMVEEMDSIPIRKTPGVKDPPLIYRYFCLLPRGRLEEQNIAEEDYVAAVVLRINRDVQGAFVFSSGQNMGAFKGVGFPEDIGGFYRLEEYRGYLWTAHGRFPTNTPGWWGGAHPFTLLNWSVVHNGELSSYGANRNYVEEFGYNCSLQTDTEAATYLFDLLVRCHGLSLEAAAKVIAPPLWEHISQMPSEQQEAARALRIVYGRGLLNGPFSILLGGKEGLMAINDRIKLRPLVAAEKGSRVYVASELAAIKAVEPDVTRTWTPRGGEPLIIRVCSNKEVTT